MLRFELRMACTRREWPLGELRRLESLHQKQTIATYERPKPKHHHRMHISEQGTRLGLLLDTEASEAKHQAYKASLADRMGNVSDWTQLQKGILCRLLQEQMDEMNEQLPFRTGLLNTTSNVSRSARTPHLCTVTVGDILLPLPLLSKQAAAKIGRCFSRGEDLQFEVWLLHRALREQSVHSYMLVFLISFHRHAQAREWKP